MRPPSILITPMAWGASPISAERKQEAPRVRDSTAQPARAGWNVNPKSGLKGRDMESLAFSPQPSSVKIPGLAAWAMELPDLRPEDLHLSEMHPWPGRVSGKAWQIRADGIRSGFMKIADLPELLLVATEAARAAGGLVRASFGTPVKVDTLEHHDIKIELDRRAQRLIEALLLAGHADYAIYGEEGISGLGDAENQWIIDPIDGTVNYFYGVPHFCVSIALRRGGRMVLGVIFDPMREELWTARRTEDGGGEVLLNGHPIRVSPRTELSEAMVTVGFSKSVAAIEAGLPILGRLAREVKKCRMMGSAALDVAYVACGRLDAYIESKISLWDIAAGALMVELAGGKVELEPLADAPDKYRAVIHSGKLDYGVQLETRVEIL